MKQNKEVDFTKYYIKPHKIMSRDVSMEDVDRLVVDAHIMYNMCHTVTGIYNGAEAIAHSQITKKDPLKFFVTREKEIIINPVIVNHTKVTINKPEGCMTFADRKPIMVPRWHKVTVTYFTLNNRGELVEKTENCSGKRAQIFQHETQCHFEQKFIYPVITKKI